ncbi:hypothetical protein Bca52824_078864 [Brassica carinata]|uniref:Uncharacterized protein n=1 Tax=Brassica carinata TaxID=52824 RepID=A0A8X7PYP9_BRACI|nr:hypothetical protein Bca52824_078864 [Brassica carinata]
MGQGEDDRSKGFSEEAANKHHHQYVYGIAEGRPVTVRQRRLPLCGIGLGWFLFVVGFFLGAIPWYVGMVIMIVGRRVDHREKPGLLLPPSL